MQVKRLLHHPHRLHAARLLLTALLNIFKQHTQLQQAAKTLLPAQPQTLMSSGCDRRASWIADKSGQRWEKLRRGGSCSTVCLIFSSTPCSWRRTCGAGSVLASACCGSHVRQRTTNLVADATVGRCNRMWCSAACGSQAHLGAIVRLIDSRTGLELHSGN